MMEDSGIYALIIKLEKNQKIKVGELGRINFPKGIYIYTGSALGGLKSRTSRHRTKQKKKIWHIDYLIASKHAKVLETIAVKTEEKLECRLNKVISSLPDAKFLINRFGCSDCKCKSHLLYFDNEDLTSQFLNLFNK